MMVELDLIPLAYREEVWKRRVIKIFIFVLVGVLLVTSVAYGALEYIKYGTRSEISELEKIKEITTSQRDILKTLNQEKTELSYKWALLSGLQSAVEAEDLLVVIDEAIQDIDIWFESLKFQRAEVEVAEESNVNTGYFIILVPGEEKQTIAIGTKMLITGEASNHSTLSSFVNNLLDQPEILDAKVLETTLSENRESFSVNFNLAITINLQNKIG